MKLNMLEIKRDVALDHIAETTYEYTSLEGVELYLLDYPGHGESLLLLPAVGEAKLLPVATQK